MSHDLVLLDAHSDHGEVVATSARSVFYSKRECESQLYAQLSQLSSQAHSLVTSAGQHAHWWPNLLDPSLNRIHEWIVGVTRWAGDINPPDVQVAEGVPRSIGGPVFITEPGSHVAKPLMIRKEGADQPEQLCQPDRYLLGPSIRIIDAPQDLAVKALLDQMIEGSHTYSLECDLFQASASAIRWLLAKGHEGHSPQYSSEDARRDYNRVVEAMISFGTDMERSPKKFSDWDEECFRDHLVSIVQLIFPDRVYGEAYNYTGKTDIIVRRNGVNVCIAECLMWDGQQYLNSKVDQLKGYLASQDRLGAIVVFNRTKNVSQVLSKAHEALIQRDDIVGLKSEDRDGRIREYELKHPLDADAIVTLTAIVFDVPQSP